MIRKFNGSKLIVPLPLSQLTFKQQFSEISKSKYKPGKKVRFAGVARIPGIVVMKYVNNHGVTCYDFSVAQACMYSNALRMHQRLSALKRGSEDQYEFLPAPVNQHDKIMMSLWRGYLHVPRDNHYELLKPWINKERNDPPPIEMFTFRQPFSKTHFGKQWAFLDYEDRYGVYLIKKKKDKKILHVGKSFAVITRVLRNHFYKNGHVNYWKNPNSYEVSIIEVPLNEAKNLAVLEKKVEELEFLLASIYLPPDNHEPKIEKLKEEKARIIFDANKIPLEELNALHVPF